MRTFIDIGSYKGEEIKWALENGYEVQAFEPNPEMRQYLQQYEDRATIRYVAAWNKDGKENLYLKNREWETDMGLSLIREKFNIDKDNSIEVQTVCIGCFLRGLGKDIEILKIDAEGAEYYIIESILEKFDPKRIKHWWIEDHSQWIESKAWQEQRIKVLEQLKLRDIIINEWKDIKTNAKLLG